MATDTPDPDRLDQLDEHIGKARSRAEDAGVLTDPDEETFAESGTVGEELDDQTIAPPG